MCRNSLFDVSNYKWIIICIIFIDLKLLQIIYVYIYREDQIKFLSVCGILVEQI